MKYLIAALFLAFCIEVSSQTFDKEILMKTEYYQLKDNKMIETDSVEMQINNRNGEHDIYIPYSKGDKVVIDVAWIEDMSGNIIRKLNNKDIQDKNYNPESVFFGDNFVKYFSLRHHVYPYKIFYTYQISYAKTLGICEIDCRGKGTPITKGKIMVETSLKESIKHKEWNVNEPTVTQKATSQIYTWHYNYIPIGIEEINRKSSNYEPVVRVIPTNFKYGMEGSFENWKTYGNWVYRLNMGRDELPDTEKAKINQLLLNVSDDKQKAKILYQYLQDYTRYVNVSLKLGGFQTYPSSYVSENKYGDCKALTYFMQAMLKFAGIKSYPALILAGEDEPKTDTTFTFPEFNHVILVVPLGKDTTFLECTSKNNPFGYLGTFTQSRPALLIEEANSHFVNTPTLTEKEVQCSTTYDIHTETSEVEFRAALRGEKYEYLSAMATQMNKNEMDLYLRKRFMPGASELLSYTINKGQRDKAEIGFNVKVHVENVTQEFGKNLRLAPFPIRLPLYESPEKRKTGVLLNSPECYADTVIYHFDKKNIAKKPSNVVINSKFGNYSLNFDVKDDKLICTKSLSILAGEYDLNLYKAFFEFIQSIKNSENKTIFIETL